MKFRLKNILSLWSWGLNLTEQMSYTEEHLDIEVNSGKKEFSELRVLFKGII